MTLSVEKCKLDNKIFLHLKLATNIDNMRNFEKAEYFTGFFRPKGLSIKH